jgi:hypothetical protein
MNSASNNSVSDLYTNDLGEVEFYNIEEGDYRILVTGEGLRRTPTAVFLKSMDGRAASRSPLP